MADVDLSSLRNHNEQMTIMIERLERHEYAREQQLCTEMERNIKMEKELHKADEDLQHAETTGIYVLQN